MQLYSSTRWNNLCTRIQKCYNIDIAVMFIKQNI